MIGVASESSDCHIDATTIVSAIMFDYWFLEKILDRVDCGQDCTCYFGTMAFLGRVGVGIVFVLKRTRHSMPRVQLMLANVIRSGSIQQRDLWTF